MVLVTHNCFGGGALYRCNQGFRQSRGLLQRTCRENSQWDGDEPTCERESLYCALWYHMFNKEHCLLNRVTFPEYCVKSYILKFIWELCLHNCNSLALQPSPLLWYAAPSLLQPMGRSRYRPPLLALLYRTAVTMVTGLMDQSVDSALPTGGGQAVNQLVSVSFYWITCSLIDWLATYNFELRCIMIWLASTSINSHRLWHPDCSSQWKCIYTSRDKSEPSSNLFLWPWAYTYRGRLPAMSEQQHVEWSTSNLSEWVKIQIYYCRYTCKSIFRCSRWKGS